VTLPSAAAASSVTLAAVRIDRPPLGLVTLGAVGGRSGRRSPAPKDARPVIASCAANSFSTEPSNTFVGVVVSERFRNRSAG
jgi:hypothetical protein